MKRGGIVGKSRTENDLAAPERCFRYFSDGRVRIDECAGRNGVSGDRNDREIVGDERMRRVDVPRCDEDGTALGSNVIESPCEHTCDEREADEGALADQRSSAGDRTRTEMATSTMR